MMIVKMKMNLMIVKMILSVSADAHPRGHASNAVTGALIISLPLPSQLLYLF